MLRIRNESLIIADTIRHIEAFCDGLVVYDDASTDSTVDIVLATSEKLIHLIRGGHWRSDRLAEETRHRRLLLDRAMWERPEWILYLDADERLAEDPRVAASSAGKFTDGLRLGLLDAYLAPDHAEGYKQGPVDTLSRLFGPEQRRILMLWRGNGKFSYLGRDQREPVAALGACVRDARVTVRHYGKALSVAHWEETCDYYATHFPEPYASKWEARRGLAIHALSDFGGALEDFDSALVNAIDITPRSTGAPYWIRRTQALLKFLRFRILGTWSQAVSDASG